MKYRKSGGVLRFVKWSLAIVGVRALARGVTGRMTEDRRQSLRLRLSV